MMLGDGMGDVWVMAWAMAWALAWAMALQMAWAMAWAMAWVVVEHRSQCLSRYALLVFSPRLSTSRIEAHVASVSSPIRHSFQPSPNPPLQLPLNLHRLQLPHNLNPLPLRLPLNPLPLCLPLPLPLPLTLTRSLACTSRSLLSVPRVSTHDRA